MTSAGPARLFGIAGKGRIDVGYDADLTIVDLKAKHTITNDWIGCARLDALRRDEVTGWPVGTIIRGERVMWEGELGPSAGEPVRFADAYFMK